MTGYEFHPDAAIDLIEIWDFIAEDNLDAADHVIANILAGIEAVVPFPPSRTQTKGPDFSPSSLYSRPRISDCLRAGRKTFVGACSNTWPAKPSRHGRDPQRQRVTQANFLRGAS